VEFANASKSRMRFNFAPPRRPPLCPDLAMIDIRIRLAALT
jgi:hypothetical protein